MNIIKESDTCEFGVSRVIRPVRVAAVPVRAYFDRTYSLTGALELQLLSLLKTDDREEDAELDGRAEVSPTIVDV